MHAILCHVSGLFIAFLDNFEQSPYGEISIAGIKGTPKRHGNTLIQLTFVHICARDRELPRSWKKDFNNITIG